MQAHDGRLVFSATDLADYLACEHLTELSRRIAEGESIEGERTEMSTFLAKQGGLHETRYLSRIEDSGATLKKFDDNVTRTASSIDVLEHAAAETESAMREGYDFIYQAFFFDGTWLGRADFLRKVPVASALGGHSYEVLDAKLARRVKPGALLQLSEYTRHVTRIQGVQPERMCVILGDTSEQTFLVNEFAAYHAGVRERFLDSVRRREETYPERVDHCGICEFKVRCDARRRDADDLSFVARMRRDQIRKLRGVGLCTLTALAEVRPDAVTVDRLPPVTLQSLHAQARLQLDGALPDGSPRWELLPEGEPGFGLCDLPEPSPGDVFFDMEGDPFAQEQGLEYLFGVVTVENGEPAYKAWLGHTPAEERAAFEAFIDWLTARLEAYPGMHVYHYADYERSALLRLMGRHGARELQIDHLLRRQVFVDLYRVVRQGVRLSTESYGLKAVEALYMPKRSGEVADAETSMIAYERWLASGDTPQLRDQSLLDEIVRYNEVDCQSTRRLRAWLETRRDERALELGEALPRRPPPTDRGPTEESLQTLNDTEALRAELVAAADGLGSSDEARATWLLAQLLGYHRREAKVQWWRWYRHRDMTPEELQDDPEALGPLRFECQVSAAGRKEIVRFRFDPQEHRMRVSKDAYTPRAVDERRDIVRAGAVTLIDDVEGVIELSRTLRIGSEGDPVFLVEGQPFGAVAQAAALFDAGRWVRDNGIDADGEHRAARDLLLRRPPRLSGEDMSPRVGEVAEQRAVRLVCALDGGCLPVQGPPGAGKTYTAARVALSLVALGRRVAVTATSHKAIGNLLEEIARAGASAHAPPRLMQKAGEGERCKAPGCRFTGDNSEVDAAVAAEDVDIVGGTAWLFARPELRGAFDTVIVDEAGQMSLADVVAVSQCARNIVLVGDPRQLAHVVQGTHPDGAGRSALDHLLGEATTVADDRGVFLDRTWRMCPEVCDFVSSAFYGGRLQSEPSCAMQAIDGEDPLTGLRLVQVGHDGDRTSSPAEAAAVARVVGDLLGRRWTGCDGVQRPLTLDDILVVAPYNAHVACVQQALPSGARVGTVDKFQGQEAAVSVFTMATSSTEDVPRNLEFLFSMNRLNVAVSRARCLSVIVCSPELLQAHCRTPEQMRLVNALCLYHEKARVWDAPAAAASLEQPVLPGIDMMRE